MEYKNSFVCYESVYRQFERLIRRGKQQEANAFIDAVMRYGLYGEKPDDDSEIWDFGFDGIIATISSAKAKYGTLDLMVSLPQLAAQKRNITRKSIFRKMNYLQC